MYSVHCLTIGHIPGTILIANWANTRSIQHCLLIGQIPNTTLFAHWAIARYNIVCPDKCQIQHCLPIGQIPGTTICQCFCLYLFLTPSAQAMACCLGVRAWGLRLGDTRLFCPSLSMGRVEEDCSPITVRSTCELISSSRNTCSVSF